MNILLIINYSIQKRKTFSRKRPEKEEDKTYINDRNKVFNNKINRYFNEYTKLVGYTLLTNYVLLTYYY